MIIVKMIKSKLNKGLFDFLNNNGIDYKIGNKLIMIDDYKISYSNKMTLINDYGFINNQGLLIKSR